MDIAEIGTPFIIQDGVRAVSEIKKSFPRLEVLADLKIMDAGEHESAQGFAAGADYVTVLGASDNATILGTVASARKYGKAVMVNMIGVADLEKRALEIEALGVDYLCVHTAFDVQSTNNPLEELQRLKSAVKKAKTAVAGGIKLSTVDAIAALHPDILIVGGGIMNAADPRAAAAAIRERMERSV